MNHKSTLMGTNDRNRRAAGCVDDCGRARPAVAPYLLSVSSSASLCPLWRIEVSLSARCAVAART